MQLKSISWLDDAVAALITAAAVILSFLLHPMWASAPIVLSWGAVLLAAWVAGRGPSLLASTVMALNIHYFRAGSLAPASLDATSGALWAAFILLALVASSEHARQRRTQYQLHTTGLDLEMLIDAAKDYAIFSLDPQGQVTWWNAGAARVFGYREDEIIGRSADILFTPEDQADQIPQKEMLTAETAGRAHDDRWQLRKDGTRFFASGMVRPITDRQGRVQGFTKVCRDITEHYLHDQARTEQLQESEAARDATEQANTLLLRFIAMAAHELRTPLASIKGFVSTLLQPDVTWDAESQRDFLQIVNEEADHLNLLIDQLQEQTRLQAHAITLYLEAVPLNRVVQQAMPQLATLTDRHRLSVTVPDDLPAVRADPARVVQVLSNLVGNAVKFSPEGAAIKLTACRSHDFVQVDVADEGPGISPVEREQIFEPFQQGSVLAREKKGSGLGLSIARGLIEAHGGRLWLQDSPGPGATFSFTLPVAPDDEPGDLPSLDRK